MARRASANDLSEQLSERCISPFNYLQIDIEGSGQPKCLNYLVRKQRKVFSNRYDMTFWGPSLSTDLLRRQKCSPITAVKSAAGVLDLSNE